MPWASGLGTSSVPVLCYHNIGGNGVPWAAFREQMLWLRARGVAFLGLDGLRRFLGGEPLPGPAVCVTFDDGFRDLYTRVGPFFAEHGLRGAVFAIADRLRPEGEPGTRAEIVAHEAHRAFTLRGDRSAWLSAAELAALVRDGLLDVGCHGAHHAMAPQGPGELADIPEHWAYAPWREGGLPGPAPRLEPELAGPRWLDEVGRRETEAEFEARAADDFLASRAALEAAVGREVTALAWPWGREHPVARRAAHAAGLDLLFTLTRGPVVRGGDLGSVCRLEVRRNRGLGWLRSRIFLYSRAFLARLYSAARV